MNRELKARIESLEAERQRPTPPRPFLYGSRSDIKRLVDEVTPPTKFNGGDEL